MLYKRNRELKRIFISYLNPTNQEIKIIEVPIESSGGKQSAKQGGENQQQSTSTSVSQRQNSVNLASSSQSSGVGGDAPPPPDPNRRSATSPEYIGDNNVGIFDWIIAWFHYWWISETADYAASWLAQQVPDNQLAHWISEHEVLTGAGFVIIGISAGYIINQTVGHWSLSPAAHRALIIGSGIRVINWFSPQIYARLSQQSHYIFLGFFGYRFGALFHTV